MLAIVLLVSCYPRYRRHYGNYWMQHLRFPIVRSLRPVPGEGQPFAHQFCAKTTRATQNCRRKHTPSHISHLTLAAQERGDPLPSKGPHLEPPTQSHDLPPTATTPRVPSTRRKKQKIINKKKQPALVQQSLV